MGHYAVCRKDRGSTVLFIHFLILLQRPSFSQVHVLANTGSFHVLVQKILKHHLRQSLKGGSKHSGTGSGATQTPWEESR